MRKVLIAALALGLAGCANSEFVEHPILSLFGDTDEPSRDSAAAPQQQQAQPPQSGRSAASANPSPGERAHCARLAKLRAQDAAFEGEDVDTQKSVYDRTFSDCVAWDAAHHS